MAAPQFIETDPSVILAEIIAQYQADTGKVLLDGQSERLLINSFAYALSLHAARVQAASESQLVNYSTGPILDELGAMVDVTRLSASKAATTLQFTVTDGHPGVVIPAGTRVATDDGQVVFATSDSLEIGVGETSGEVTAECESTGAVGNDILAGQITNILDPIAYVTASENLTDTVGGGDEETDEALRERIKLAPSSYTTAGSVGAYKFHARSASQLIVDVAVTTPAPGVVNVYPMVSGGGTTPDEILEAVEEKTSAETVRPLCDTVNVLSPTTTLYDIDVDVTLYDDAVQDTVEAEIAANLDAFKELQGAKLGRDIMLSQIIAQGTKVSGVYNVEVVSPVADLIIDATEVAICSSVVVNIVGLNEG